MAKNKPKEERVLETDQTVKVPVENIPAENVTVIVDAPVVDVVEDKVEPVETAPVVEPVIEPIKVEPLPEVVNEPVKPKGNQFTAFSKTDIPSVEPKLYDKKVDGKYETVKFVKDLTEIKIIDSWVSGKIGETKKLTSEQANILRAAKVIL